MGGKASQKDVQRVLGMRYEGSWEAQGLGWCVASLAAASLVGVDFNRRQWVQGRRPNARYRRPHSDG